MTSPELLFQALLPGIAVGAQERWNSPGDPGLDGLYAEELALVAAASEHRRGQFAAGRRCAHRALAALGHPPGPVLAGLERDPLWPAGVVGSITHTDGYAAAVVAPADAIRGVGLDAERVRSLSPAQRATITAPGEVLPEVAADHLDPALVTFCAKEAAFKAVFPLMRRFVDYHHAQVLFRADGFRVEVARAALQRQEHLVEGRWHLVEGLVLAVAFVE